MAIQRVTIQPRSVPPWLPFLIVLPAAFLSAQCAQHAATRPSSPRAERTSSADGVPIAYTMQGQGSTTLVFVHGWSCDRTYWSNQLASFARTRRVVAIDLAGHGESGTGRKEWTVQSLAVDVVAVLQAEDLRDVILVGHSMGGPVSLLAAQAMPQRVIGVVAVDALHDAEASNEEQMRAFADTLEADFPGGLRRMVPQYLFRPDADPELVTRVAEDMSQAPPGPAIALIESTARFDLKRALSGVRVPVRGINGAPTNVAANRRYAHDFDVVQMEGVGHFPMLERPEAFNAILGRVVAEIEALERESVSARP